MTFDVEIVLREQSHAVTARVTHPGNAAEWTDDDVEQVLKEILLSIDRVKNPNNEARHVALRGFSWIVEPSGEGEVVIAIEIPMGAAVAGPFTVDAAVLDRAISRVLARSAPRRPTVH